MCRVRPSKELGKHTVGANQLLGKQEVGVSRQIHVASPNQINTLDVMPVHMLKHRCL